MKWTSHSDVNTERGLAEHRLSSLCARRSYTPLLLLRREASEAAGYKPAGRTGHRPVFLTLLLLWPRV
jgi:hypothetical protein